jgi:predicted dehydrogenase
LYCDISTPSQIKSKEFGAIIVSKPKSRRDFLKQASAGTSLLSAWSASNAAAPVFATGKVLGANDRLNFGFIGCGGRMNSHIDLLKRRATEQGDVQLVAVCDIYDKRKQLARERAGVDEKSVYHDFRELCARKDIDAVVIASPDHWHHGHAMAALRAGKDVYLEKPFTYTIDEAREIAEFVRASFKSGNGRILQVGSQYTSFDHFHQARKAIEDGLIGKVVWATAGYGRNANKEGGEWNYKIDEDASEKNIDWKAFLGNAPKRAFSAERYFRWRKYWDYSGGIATDLFYHALAPLVMITGQQFPERVTASGGIFVQKDREVPDTLLMNVDYASFTVNLSCSVAAGAPPLVAVNGTEGRIILAQSGEDFSHSAIEVIPDREYRKEFKAKTGVEKLSLACKPSVRGAAPHMDNFLDAVRSRQQPNLPAELGYKVMAAIRMGVDAYRQQTMMQWDGRRERAAARVAKI